jgi:murein DD-endopeptidase MepM/ murein hydrolase activator NlpD
MGGCTLNSIWLILPNIQEPGPDRFGRYRVTKRASALIYSAIVLALAAIPVLIAHASVFSFVAELFEREANAQVISSSPFNSQTMPLLYAALHVDPDPSKGGGDIMVVGGSALLSESGPSGTEADIKNQPPSDRISIYVVREGDSLSQIAEMFNVTVNTIIWANDISRGSLIQVGQTLVILPISGVRHTVEKGDTLKSIAKKYKGDLEEILQYNGLTEDAVLSVGDVVIIPDGEVVVPVYTPSYSGKSGGSSSYSGYYLRPISGGIKTQGIHGYNGVDLATYYGAPILAAASGQVIVSKSYGWNGGYGLYIVIQHDNGTQTLYAHNSKNIVSQGEYVVRGQVIGYVGSSGRSTGAHVHFEVRGARNPF